MGWLVELPGGRQAALGLRASIWSCGGACVVWISESFLDDDLTESHFDVFELSEMELSELLELSEMLAMPLLALARGSASSEQPLPPEATMVAMS